MIVQKVLSFIQRTKESELVVIANLQVYGFLSLMILWISMSRFTETCVDGVRNGTQVLLEQPLHHNRDIFNDYFCGGTWR